MKFKGCQGFVLLVVLVSVLSGCGMFKPGEPEVQSLRKLSSSRYPVFSDSRSFEGLKESIDQSLVYFSRVPESRVYRFGKEIYPASHMALSLETFRAFLEDDPGPDELNEYIKANYQVYQSVGNEEGEVLFTGYYEPTYKGSLVADDTYLYPVYSRPSDMVQIDLSLFSDKYKGHSRLTARVNPETKRVVPYYERKEINGKEDFGLRAEPVVWLASRVDRFFLEIQGSGRVELVQGGIMRVQYAASNGNAYKSIGRYLIDLGEIPKEEMSMQAIRKWLEANPHRMDEVLHYNGSFVFFREGHGGPYGSIGVAVTPMRSIATDNALFPRGGLAFVETSLPDISIRRDRSEWESASLFVLNQDTGGAIKSPGRVDLFCGNGEYAEFTAGNMNVRGQVYFLVLKQE